MLDNFNYKEINIMLTILISLLLAIMIVGWSIKLRDSSGAYRKAWARKDAKAARQELETKTKNTESVVYFGIGGRP